MAPPVQTFPLSELPDRSREYTVNHKTKIRKPPTDFETCDLYELVQYSCVTKETSAGKRQECFPFTRLFRRCGEGDKMYHVETTAWEGEHAYTDPSLGTAEKSKNVDVKRATKQNMKQDTKQETADIFAQYGKYFWSKK